MMKYEDLIAELSASQHRAACIDKNAVIASGAGSGKTKVLAARYIHLIVEKKIPVGEILALTFTTKAAAEMYTRIYDTLNTIDAPEAKEAIENFHEATISTLDSFCNSVARIASRQYGISPDYEIDNQKATDIAFELALPFFLENRKSVALQHLLKRYTQQELSENLFAETMVRFSPVTKPLSFENFLAIQQNEINTLFPSTSKELLREIQNLKNIEGGTGKTWEELCTVLEDLPSLPEVHDLGSISQMENFLTRLKRISFRGKVTNPSLVEAKEILSGIKKEIAPQFLALSNYVLHKDLVEKTFCLLSDFQILFHKAKRMQGILTFADVSQLALDALTNDPDLRASYKKSISSIMIDEFQDDNELQRNLLFLIAEKTERRERSVPSPEELSPDKLFFVGDEKQSIYRFRGADVSVFRALAKDFTTKNTPVLDTNYRTETALIQTFNYIFPFVFLNSALWAEIDFPLYEATFSPITPHKNTKGLQPGLELILIDSEQTEDEEDTLTATETEAAEIAKRIRNLVDSGFTISDKKELRPCQWSDFAILFRSGTRQHLFEKHLRFHGIPYQAESLRGLFTDAPINDLYAILRLAIYPADTEAYAMLLRSPFSGVSDISFTQALLERQHPKDQSKSFGEPFPAYIEQVLPEEDLPRFQKMRVLYQKVREKADHIPICELITQLWYNEGYRYAVISKPSLHHYIELYDYFFELARQADAKGENLATFLDRIAHLMRSGDKIDDLNIPVDRQGGVHLMTVHKSKGLEFPVVFLVDCHNPGMAERNSLPVYYSPETGISVNTGASEEAETAKDNWFYLKGKEEEKKRSQAEIRRLLYVAMTRAENRLYMSGVFKLELGSEENPNISEKIGIWLDKKDERAEKDGKPISRRSFFDFLLPAFAQGTISGATISAIQPQQRETNSEHLQTFDPPQSLWYEKIPLAEYKKSKRRNYSATALHDLLAKNTCDQAERELAPAQIKITEKDSLALLLEKLDISATEFGTYAHRAIEAEFTKTPAFIDERIHSITEEMAERFLSSLLGIQASKALWRQSEYDFITTYSVRLPQAQEDTELIVTGQMDLIFETPDSVIVVDYKTDKDEDPSLHAEQLAVYRKAATELRKKPAQTWLFYLRSGKAVRV